MDNPQNLALWLVPYLAVTLIRSISWSIKTLNISKRALYGTGACVAVVVAAAVTVAIMDAKKRERGAAVRRARTNEEFAEQLLRRNNLDDAKAQLLFAADNWHIANQLDEEKRVRQKESTLGPWSVYGAQERTWGQFDEVILPQTAATPQKHDIFDDLVPARAARPQKSAKPFDPDRYLGIKKPVSTPSPSRPP